MSRYSSDPYWLTARFNSECHGCKAPVRKGQQAFYYPNGKRIYGMECGCAIFKAADFDSHAFDDATMGSQF